MTYQEFKDTLKAGNTLTITEHPGYWSSHKGGKKGLNIVTYPYTLKVEVCEIEHSKTSSEYIAVVDSNGYGWAIDGDTLNYFVLENSRTDRIKNLNL